jgi:flagellar hook-associated protein 3 FlgL
MRITNNMLINNMINYIGNNLTRMDKYQSQLATGKKISVPSDDPVVAARALKLRTNVAEIEQYQKNTKDAQSWMDTTEDSLSSIGDILQRTRELTVQASNGTNTTDDAQKISTEVKQLKEQLIQLGNSTYAGRYIFSGYKTNTKLLDDTGKFAINVSNNENIKYEIGIGDDININVVGGDLFNAGANAVGNSSGVTTGNSPVSSFIVNAGDSLGINIDGTGLFTVNLTPSTPLGYTDINALAAGLQNDINTAPAKPLGTSPIKVTAIGGKLQFTSGTTGMASNIVINPATDPVTAAALGLSTSTPVTGTDSTKGKLISDFDQLITEMDNGNTTGVGSMLSNLDADMDNVLRIRADIGARSNRIDLTSNRLDSSNLNFTKLMSSNEDVDMVDTIMNLQNEENVYKASLSGGARIIQPSLVDFLR